MFRTFFTVFVLHTHLIC